MEEKGKHKIDRDLRNIILLCALGVICTIIIHIVSPKVFDEKTTYTKEQLTSNITASDISDSSGVIKNVTLYYRITETKDSYYTVYFESGSNESVAFYEVFKQTDFERLFKDYNYETAIANANAIKKDLQYINLTAKVIDQKYTATIYRIGADSRELITNKELGKLKEVYAEIVYSARGSYLLTDYTKGKEVKRVDVEEQIRNELYMFDSLDMSIGYWNNILDEEMFRVNR